MTDIQSSSVIKNITSQIKSLTPKGRILGNYIMENPRKAVFMTTKELSEACKVSEATVVRFVGQLGYDGYSDFLQALRDYVEAGMTLRDRVDLPKVKGPGADRFHQAVCEEMNNLKQLCDTLDMKAMETFVELIQESEAVYVAGSRISYSYAHYLGWALTKVKKGVHILKGSDSASIDWLANAPDDSLVVIIATSRYPNELIRLSKATRRLGHRLMVITDSKLCPLIPFANMSLIAPSKSISLIGYPSAIMCIANYIVMEIAGKRDDDRINTHQEKLERIYLENDILFNMHMEAFKE